MSPRPVLISPQRTLSAIDDSSPTVSHANGKGRMRKAPQTAEAKMNPTWCAMVSIPPRCGYERITWPKSYSSQLRKMLFVRSVIAAGTCHGWSRFHGIASCTSAGAFTSAKRCVRPSPPTMHAWTNATMYDGPSRTSFSLFASALRKPSRSTAPWSAQRARRNSSSQTITPGPTEYIRRLKTNSIDFTANVFRTPHTSPPVSLPQSPSPLFVEPPRCARWERTSSKKSTF